MNERIKLRNIASLHNIFDILEKIPEINIKKGRKHIPNSKTEYVMELKVSMFPHSMRSDSRIEFIDFNFENPSLGFQEISIKGQMNVRGSQIDHLKYLIRDIITRIMTDYLKPEVQFRDDTFNLKDYIIKNIEYLVKEEIIC